jgi:hypothetical protein
VGGGVGLPQLAEMRNYQILTVKSQIKGYQDIRFGVQNYNKFGFKVKGERRRRRRRRRRLRKR